MKKNVSAAMNDTSVHERYGIYRDEQVSGVYYKFLVNRDAVELLLANGINATELMRLVFVLHLGRYWFSKKLAKIIERTLTSSKTDRSRLFRILRELGLLDHTGYWSGDDAAEYRLQGLAALEGAYSFPVDAPGLRGLLWTLYRKEMKAVEQSNNWKGVFIPANWKDFVDVSCIEKAEETDALVEKINRGEFEPNRKQTQERRLYSAFTRLNKLVRPLLRSKNRNSFCLIDVKTSQPRLMSLVFRKMVDELLSNEFAVEKMLMWLEERGKILQQNDLIDCILNDIVRLKAYFDDETHDLYSDVAESFGSERDATKKGVVVFMYDSRSEDVRNDDERVKDIVSYLRLEYPYLSLFIEYGKYVEFGMKLAAKNKGSRVYYAYSPFYRLTEMESELILDEACPIFRKKFPDANLITIHDGIMVEPQYVDAMKSILVDAYGAKGIRVVLTVESFA